MKEEHKKRFRELAEQGNLADLCRGHSSLNLSVRTIGGTVFWNTTECCGWKLQEHRISGRWRILDPGNIRRAWGITSHHLNEFFLNHPVSMIENYLEEGGRFFRYPGSDRETVVLVHGWGVRSCFMSRMAVFLQGNGYSVLNYDYATAEKTIQAHGQQFLEGLRREKISGKIHFVVHSMGGLVLRYAMAEMTGEECRKIESIVMLGTPNQGSQMARFGKILFYDRIDHSLGEMIPGSSALKIPKAAYYPPIGIIAGRFDGKVSVKRTSLPDGIPFEKIVMKCNHPQLRDPNLTGRQILKFLRDKTF